MIYDDDRNIGGQFNCDDNTDNLIERLWLITQGLLNGHEKEYDGKLNLSRWGDPDMQEFHELLARMRKSDEYPKLSTFEKLDKLSKVKLPFPLQTLKLIEE
jgi:hypothetical protein